MKHLFYSIGSLSRRLALLVMLVGLWACKGGSNKTEARETTSNGTINISVDESFKPIIDSQIKVFEAAYPNAKIVAHYKPEAECLRDLTRDSTRMIIITRILTREEEDFYKDSIRYVPIMGRLAYDAVTVIVNNKSPDSVFSMSDIQAILSGTSQLKLRPVFDGTSATSTVRFAIDSILKGRPLGKNVTAARSSQAVIDYVADNVDAIGFIGVSWIGNKEDVNQLSFLQKVNIASIQCGICNSETYVKPYQANIALKRYPMVRGLHYILKENFGGVGSGFVNFLEGERGQLIFRRAYLVPYKMSFNVRDVEM
ncbi:MAG TPA: substrate-binding domain-containing protein [Chitinophagaceae bacterium]|nr:substrate-binding domain-containing protein [Chitinophagaceae bacterium]